VCARWNLAPIEERWEPVETAEKLFRDARLRVQSENVGIAQLPGGTRLVRVGSAVPGELAAWRYGTQLLRRRKRYLVTGGLGIAATVAFYGGMAAAGTGMFGLWMAGTFVESRRQQKVVHRIGGSDEKGEHAVIRKWHLEGINLDRPSFGDDIEVHVRDGHRKKPRGWDGKVRRESPDMLVVSGADARALLARAMVHVNRKGATPAMLEEANRRLASVDSPERVLHIAAQHGAALGKRAGQQPYLMKDTDSLVLEMALNEESERRALEGELTTLTAAWREAEEIAAIADALPGEASLNRLIDRLSR
jgi:hypothetical protein